jgi:uncharacterized protein YggE
MKNNTATIIVIGIAALGFLFMISSKGNESAEPRLIYVIGEAEVKVVPDEIIFCVGASTWHKILQKAKDENDSIVKKVKKIAEEFNIAAKYIMTDYINIVPDYNEGYNFHGTRIIEGYNVYDRISITLKNVEQFEEFLSRLLETGINYVYQIQFRTTKLSEHREKARSLALAAAKQKAVSMAAELGQKIGRPLAINELQPERYWQNRNSYLLTNVAVNANTPANASEMDTISLGQIPIKETVSVSFELE